METTPIERLNRRTILTIGAVGVGALLAGCVGRGFGADRDATETIEESFPAPTVDSISATNAVGDVLVSAVGTGDVDVQVRKRSPVGRAGLDDIDVSIDLEEGALTVETTVDRGATWFDSESPQTDVTITVPEGAAGPAIAAVTTDLGDVTLLDTRGDTAVRTELGEITASGVDGYLSLRSKLGTVLASDVRGIDAVHTDLGDVKVDLLGVRDDVEIGTKLGSVTVGVADDLDLDVLAETNGGLDSNLPVTDSRIVGSRLTGRLNAGGRRLHVYGDLGDLSLRSIAIDER